MPKPLPCRREARAHARRLAKKAHCNAQRANPNTLTPKPSPDMPVPTTCQPFKFILVIIDEHTLGAISPLLAIEPCTLAYSVVGPPELPLWANVLHSSILRGGYLTNHSRVFLSGRRVRLATQQDIEAYGYQPSLPGEGFQDANWYTWDTQQPEAAGEPVLLGGEGWPAYAAEPPS